LGKPEAAVQEGQTGYNFEMLSHPMISDSPHNYVQAYASGGGGGAPISKLADIKSRYMSNTATVSSQNKRPSHHKRLEFVKPSNSSAQMINDCISLPVQTATGESPLQTSPARAYYTANTENGQQKPTLSPPEEEEEDEEGQHSYSESLESKT
jgi:hypothetical protein